MKSKLIITKVIKQVKETKPCKQDKPTKTSL